jgi:hypothetical protein
MTTEWNATVSVAAPATTIWDVMVDVPRWSEWSPTVTEASWVDGSLMRIGGRARLKQPRLGVAVWEVTELEDGRSFLWVRRSPGVTTIAGHVLAGDAEGNTVVSLTIAQTGPLAGVVSWLTGSLTKRYLDMEAASLKRRCEQ